jgi:hypothetical protein
MLGTYIEPEFKRVTQSGASGHHTGHEAWGVPRGIRAKAGAFRAHLSARLGAARAWVVRGRPISDVRRETFGPNAWNARRGARWFAGQQGTSIARLPADVACLADGARRGVGVFQASGRRLRTRPAELDHRISRLVEPRRRARGGSGAADGEPQPSRRQASVGRARLGRCAAVPRAPAGVFGGSNARRASYAVHARLPALAGVRDAHAFTFNAASFRALDERLPWSVLGSSGARARALTNGMRSFP